MAPKKPHTGPLTEEEAEARMNKLAEIITSEAQKEINQVTAQSTEDIDELKKTLVSEPKQIIDEWIEKLRAFTERQTKIHCARLRRIAKLRILEAYGDIRNSIKNEARERIKDKMCRKTAESDRLLGLMLLQGLFRLMEPKVLVHTTKADLERVSKHYEAVTKQYKEMTGNDLKLITSRHPLKEHYFGRIVISDKVSSMFVDMNLFTSVDQVADEVFSHYAAYHDKTGTSKNWGMELLKQRGLQIMPRGPNISPLQIDTILSTMRGDPRTQAPVFQIREDVKKQEASEEEVEERRRPSHRSAGSFASQKQRGSVNMGRRKVTIAPEAMAMGMRPSLSMMEPGSYGSKYGYRVTQDSSEDIVDSSNDLYNLDFTSTTDILSLAPSRAAMSTASNSPEFIAAQKKSLISADKEAPKGPEKMPIADGWSRTSESGGSEKSRFSGESYDGSPPAPPPSFDLQSSLDPPTEGPEPEPSPTNNSKESSPKNK